MNRRDFLYVGGIGLAAAQLYGLPLFGKPIVQEAALDRMPVPRKKELADVALNTASALGAVYADIRIGRYINQFAYAREKELQVAYSTESYGIGVRVLVNGCWGFAGTDVFEKDSIQKVTAIAVNMAKQNARLLNSPVVFTPREGLGEVNWQTPIEQNAFEVPIKEKSELLLAVNDRALQGGASFANASLYFINEQKYFASTEGSYIDQDIHRLQPLFSLTRVDGNTGSFVTRNSLGSPRSSGYEYLVPNAADKVHIGPVTVYKDSYDMLEDAAAGAGQLKEKMQAAVAPPGKSDLVLDPTNLWLTIHQTIGRNTEMTQLLDPEKAYNYASASFLTLDKFQSRQFAIAGKSVNFAADRTSRGALATVGYDDEGVKTQQWDLVREGLLVDVQAIRDQVNIIGGQQPRGCAYADSWSTIQQQRMANVSLQPGHSPLSPQQLIKSVEKGIYVVGDGPYAMGKDGNDFQFGGQLFYEIRNGEIKNMLKDLAYASNTATFWQTCKGICDQRDFRTGGMFSTAKKEGDQSGFVSHGSATALFSEIEIASTARKI